MLTAACLLACLLWLADLVVQWAADSSHPALMTTAPQKGDLLPELPTSAACHGTFSMSSSLPFTMRVFFVESVKLASSVWRKPTDLLRADEPQGTQGPLGA